VSLEKNKAIVRRLYKAVNTRDLSSIEDFMAPDYVDHTRKIRGLADIKKIRNYAFQCFSRFP